MCATPCPLKYAFGAPQWISIERVVCDFAVSWAKLTGTHTGEAVWSYQGRADNRQLLEAAKESAKQSDNIRAGFIQLYFDLYFIFNNIN